MEHLQERLANAVITNVRVERVGGSLTCTIAGEAFRFVNTDGGVVLGEGTRYAGGTAVGYWTELGGWEFSDRFFYSVCDLGKIEFVSVK